MFEGMMQSLYKEDGSQFRVELIANPAVQDFINTHASILDSTFEKVEMSDLMRRRLTGSNYIFSGMKAFHELNEAFPSLLDENGNRKSFERFLNDVQTIDKTYNSNYLRAEYNFVAGSAEMAARWESFMEDGDRYNLQYRTHRDDKVRPEHAALDRVTLPPTDSFWEEFYPPNGWNCRCTVTQVRKSKFPATDHDEAMRLGDEALQRDKKGMFRFNPGKEGKTVPDYNPYTTSKCRSCNVPKGKLNLVANIPNNNLCAGCLVVRAMDASYSIVPDTNGKVRISNKHGKPEKKENVSVASYLAKKHGWSIDLLPKDDKGKNADSFNKTLGYKQEYKVNGTESVTSIDNLIRKGAKQADSIVLRIDSDISFGDLRDALSSRVLRCKKLREVMLVRNNLDVTFSREDIISPYFKIQPEDFK